MRVSRTYDPNGTLSGFFCIGPERIRPFDVLCVNPSGNPLQVSVRVTRDVPFEIVERNFKRCGSGPYMPVAIATLRYLLAP